MHYRKLSIALAVVALSGCAGLKEAFYRPKLQITEPMPAAQNLGAVKTIVIAEIVGARSREQAQLAGEIQRQGRVGGYFQVTDLSEKGITFNVSGRTATASTMPKSGEGFLQAKFFPSETEQVTKVVTEKNAQGVEVQRQVSAYRAKAPFSFLVLNAKGRAVVNDIDGTAEAASKDAALEAALNNAVSQFFAAVTPHKAPRELVFDKSDLAQRPMLDMAADGNVARATDDMRAFLGANASNATAMFNLAVLLEAGGKYQEALDLYTKAAELAPTKAEYGPAKIACAKALANQQAFAD